jgi:hypothetical protein
MFEGATSIAYEAGTDEVSGRLLSDEKAMEMLHCRSRARVLHCRRRKIRHQVGIQETKNRIPWFYLVPQEGNCGVAVWSSPNS